MQETEFVLDAADRLSTGQSTGTTPVVSQLLDSRTAFSTTVFAAPIPELAVATLRDACGLCSCLPNMLLLSSNKLLQQLSLQLLRPCTTREIAARPIVRRLLLDLVSRWLLPDFPVVEAICAHHSRGYLHAYDLYSTSTSSSTCSKKTYRDGFASPNSVIESGQSNSLTTLLFLHAFAELLPLAPHIQVIAFACFQKAALSPVSILCEALTVIFQEELASEKQQQKQEEPNFTAFLAIASSLYNLTRGSYISTITDLWDFAPIFELINLHARDLCHFTYDGAADAAVLLAYLVHIMANVLGMTDVERGGALEKFLGELYYTDERITLLRLFHEEEEEIARALMFNDDAAPFGNILTVITAADLSPFVVDIAGVLLPKPDISSVALLHDVGRTRQLVWTETTRRNLNRIAISVSIGAPVLVTGSSGVGKTSLVEEIARMVGQKDLLKIHLGDQTDSKILLGTYVCQSEPGSFKWQPGILTTAVTNGRWVLIEDLDLAPLEVVSVLIPLLETGHLFIPARGEKVRAKQGFQLFATQTLSSGSGKFGLSSRMAGSNGEVGAALWNRITVDAIPGSEMIQVIETMYPNLGSQYNLGMHIVKTFEKLVETFHVTVSISRSVSFRDVIKWCNRLEKLHSEVLSSCRLNESDCKIESISLLARESLFREALECFTMMIQNTKVRERAAQCVAQILAIPNMRLEFFTEHYQPTLVTDAGEDEIGKNSVKIGAHSKVVVGRVTLSFAKNPTKAFETANKFAYTSLSLRLLEKLAVCISMQEAVLLTGETGTGKTTIVQQLANMCGKSLTVINMSQQSDSTDLLGGFKPVEATMIAMPMLERFEVLFGRTFSSTANSAFLESIRSAYIKKKWDILKLGFGNAVRMADKVLGLQKSMDGEPQVKKSKKRQADPALIADWIEFSTLVKAFSAQLDHLKNSFLFSFVEGTLVKAIVRGDWILLDEVNLASTETLESLSGILQSATGSLLLLERGDTEPIKRHSDFRLFACMNPANDAGKRDLPPGLLSRFSEIWVDSPDTIPQDLVLIIRKHLNSCLPPPTQGGNAIVANIAEFHTSIKAASESGYLVDGAGQKVYINLRTLTRALGFAASCAETYGLPRGIYEGCQMTYATILGKDSLVVAQKLFEKHIMNGIKNQGSFIRNVPKMDEDDDSQILFGTYWIKKGLLVPDVATKYVLTPSVDANLSRVARAVMARKYPVLIQGPTSAGKTSMVEYLAMRTGHRFIRVNNHEHTDLQEYIGTYVSNAEGKLVFREGILVEALRKGHWIVLDELNLAPSDVLESLNRLLDDNRELLIPETQEIVRPHPSFMLFATQNPPGLYGGRKQLSRAFRSRFIELHFDDIPEPELSTILERRCRLPPSYSAKIVACYKGLQNARQRSRIFEGKNAFATLRDLFRWGNRPANSIQELAENGFMVIAEKSRRDDEKEVVRNVIEHTFKLKIDPDTVYHREWSLFMEKTDVKNEFVQQIVWTNAMKRLFILVLKCIINTEPILLVGETGCGKTTVCQILTTLMGVNLQIVNAHAGSETSDFIGSMRPVRGRDRILSDALTAISSLWEEIAEVTSLESDKNFGANINIQFAECHSNLQILIDLIKSRLSQILNQPDSWPSKIAEIEKLNIESKRMFEWSDGPLVNAMRKGEAFLLDEISLADDSVLERLNSVLESERLLVLAERGAVNIEGKDSLDPNYSHIEEIRGHTNFSFMATMNPGGDYGKKELSPALRNRFTELWVPSIGDKKDLTMIINQRLESLKADSILAESISILLLDFLDWFAGKLGMVRTSIVSLRDIMAWVSFVTTMVKQNNDSGMSNLLLLCKSIFHGGCMVLLDGIGVNPLFGSMLGSAVASGFRKECSKKLAEDIFQQFMSETDVSKENFLIQIGFYLDKINIIRENNVFGIPPFLVECGPAAKSDDRFALQAPTTSINALRVLRALRLSKPVLLEGSPGVGKSSLISSLAITCGYPLCRINLSEQTDLMDLFGSDLPVEGGKGGEFAWRDGPFLSAMKNGQWILLDELNLATQQVLEGLNACLDHRATVYIPELNRSFECHKNFRVFAAQNPQNQGGGRKGLPKSFVNRFTQVYIEGLTGDDMAFIIKNLNPEIDPTVIKKMIDFNQAMHQETMVRHSFGIRGSPWEFNLRDILRWIELLRSNTDVSSPQMFLNMIYCHRMRTEADETAVIELFNTHFTPEIVPKCSLYVSPNSVSVGSSILPRSGKRHPHSRGYVTGDKLGVLTSQLPILESLIKCVEMSWMAILCGPTSSGKTSIVRFLAKLAGQQLDEFSMNSGIDAVELLGGFEQVDLNRREQTIIRFIEHTLDVTFRYIGSANFIMEDSDAIKTVFLLQSRLRSLKKFDSLLDIDAVNSLLKVLSQMIKIFGESLHAYISNAGAKKPEDISEMCEQLLYLRTSGVHGQFEWIDGTLIKALEEGRWILIDNANMCPASVLDRLNHLLEPNGVLIVNERGLVNGQVKIIHPHKNFRMFMTMDPQQGEISRAMRNRGVELFIRPPTQDFERQAADAYDIINLLNGYGLPGAILPSMLKSLHHHVSSLFHKLHIPFEDSTAIMIRFVKLAIERLERGFPWFHSVKQTFSDVYLDLTTLDALPEEISGQLREYLVIFATSNRNSNLVEIAAGSWPIRVSGKFSVEESLLAEASLEASLLLSFSFVTIDTNLFGYNTLASDQRDLLLPIPNSLQLLQAAFFRFVEESEGVFSFFAKGQLLRHISKRFIKNSSIAKLFELANNLQSFAQKIKRNLPSAKFGILLRLQEFSLLKSQIVLSNPNSIIGISESFFNHRTSEHNLPHKVFKYLYAFFSSLQECLFAIVSTSSAIDYSDILQILCATEYFLRLIDTESLNPTDLTLAFQSALQAIKKSATISKELSHPCHNATINLRDAIEGCYSSLDIRAFECLSALWRNSSFTTLRDKQLIDIELEFTNISERLRLRKKITEILTQPLMFIEQKIKHSILEAVSTLYFLNESYSSTETKNMLKMIAAVPKEITIVLNKIEETIGGKTISFFDLSASLEQSLLTLELVGSKGIDLGVMPITEIISLRNQNLMLARLSNLVLDSLSGSEIKTQLALLASEIQEIINYEIMETLNISQNLHPLQRILWKLNSKWVDNVADDQFISEVKDILYEACYRWHERVWNNSCTVLLNSETYSRDILLCNGNVHEIPKSRAAPPPVNIVNGPEILNYSIGTKIGMHLLGSMVSVPIYSFESKITQLQKLLKVYNEPIITSYIPEALKGGLDMAFLILQQIVLGHEHYFVAEKFASLSSKISSLRVEIYSSPNIAHESIIEIKKEFEILPEKQSKYLLKLMADLSDISIWGLSVLLIGKVFVSVSMAFLRSYLPSTAIDPALSAQAQINILSAMKERIKADILVKLELAFLANSNVKSSNDGNFDSLREIEISEKKIRSRMVYRPEQSQIASIVNDLSHLGNNILRDDVLSLCLADTSDFKHNLFLQENLESFIERMEYKYPLYRDILQPVFLSLYQLRHGLVSLTAEREYYSEISPEVNRLVRNLLEFSGFLNSEELIGPDFVLALKDVTVLASRQTEINVLIAVIRRFCWGIDYQQVLSDCDLSIIHIWFNELSDKWLEAEALIVEQDKKKSELYKYKERTHEFLSEEEIEAQELLEIFPDFYDEFDSSENELGERKAAQQNQPSSLNSSGVVFQLDDIIAFQIRELHENIFSSVTLSNEKLKEIYKHVYLNSFETTSKIFEEIVNPVNFQFEVSSRAGKIFLTQTRLDSFMSVGDDFSKISEDFDFYRDYNIGEARKLQAILKSVDVMTSKLLNEWPENMLLSHLRVIHNRIASFSITTPIMKLLTGLELLFQKCHEWETVASSAVSMKSHLDEMTSLIVRWRKIELQTWKSLLKNEDRMADMKSSKLWFHLFKSLVGPALAHGNGVDDVEKVIESDLVASLDQLFLGSSLGGFHGRLALIQSFQKHLSIIRSQSKHIKAIDIMLNVLWNVYQYYFQFSDFIKTHIENQRKPIVKELDGYVRIATWKDVNVFALKESSKKSHHHLHKFVKKYRAILSMPVKDVIAAYLQDAAVEGGIVRAKSKNALSPLFSPSKEILIVENDLVSNFIGQRDIGKLVVRMQTLSYNLISGGQNLRLADGIEDLSTSIIERIRFFQTPPEADSVLKGQRSIRKKALVDLLKYLEYLGLSPNSSVKYRKHQDSTYLFSLSKLDATTTLSGAKFTGFDTNLNDATIAVLKRADVYYFKLLARMVVVREAALSFNRDLTDREMAKSLSFLENILEVIIDQRCELAKSSDLTSMSVTEGVKRCYLNLKNTTTESESFTPVNISFHVADSMIKAHKNAVDEIDAMLTQSLIVMECICKSTSLPCDSILQVVAIQNALTPSKSRASVIYERYCLRESGEVLPFIATVEIVDCLNQVRSDLESTLGNLKIAMSTYASVSWLFENICERLIIRQNELRSCMNETLDSNEDTKSKEIMNDIFLSDVSKMCEKLIDSILVAFQDLLHKDDSLISPTEFTGTMDMVQSPEFDEFGLQQGNILKSQAVFSRNFKEPRLKTISVNITKILSLINKPPPTSSAVLVQEASNTLGKLYPLLQQYLRIYQFYVYEYIGFHKATVKLAYILVNSFTVLFKKGFCIPDDDQSEVQDQKEEEDATGTGIGEGEGTKDVSNEIEDESQVEGLKSDEPAPKPEKKMKEEKDGVEMEGDFDGVLEDVSDNGEEEDEGEKEEKDGEEQMGDVDEDLADVVDEKLWDGDENAQNEEGKAEKDSKADTKPGDMDDLVAKEDDDKGEKEPPKKPDEKNDSQDTRTEVDDQIGNEDVTDEILEDLINDMENENEDNTGVKPKSSIDEDDSQQEKEDEIDLPEDLNLDTEAENAGKDEQFDMNVDKDDRPDSPVNDSISEQDGMEDQEFPLEEADAQMDRLDEKAEDEEMVEQEDVDESGGDNALPESTPKEDQDMINSEEPDNEVNDEKDEEMLQTNAKDRNVANSESQKTKDNIVNAAAENNEQENLSTEVNATASTGQDSQKRDGGKNDVANEKESTETQNENKNQKPSDFDLNPHRSLGDATKKWMNRLKSLFDRETEEEKQPDAVQNTEEEQQQEFDRENDFEFVENDLSSFDAQVLHDANNEQMDKMDQKALADGKKNEEDAMEIDQSEDEEEDENSKIPNESKSEPNEAENQGKVVNIPKSGKLHDKDENMPENEGHTDEEEGKKLEETFEESNSNEFDVESLKFHEHTNQDAEEEDIEPLDELAFEEIRKQLQESTEEWRKTGQDIAKAHLLWRKYSSLTRELSYSLCESLRLILEPSLATKLKGDYRAGKRLNMRKVIAYIASQFKKDKIWLRRTRPSKRTYQIMISIDDSRSMAESKSIELAFESLSLISKALTQLEVGEISVVSFGDDVRLLHPFDKQFSDEAGAEVIHNFTFDQNGTQVRKMMEATIDILKIARQSSQGSSELWQLQLIISDGILEDHAAVRALVRQAADAKIMVVFVVLDKRGEQDSILRMTNVSYGAGGLQMTRYMDTFPFEFYVVLNRIEDLPEVLSDTLRQYFSFVSL